MADRKSLPFASEFSPSQIDLPDLLEMAVLHDGDRSKLEAAIRQRFFSKHSGGNARNQKKLAMNCWLGMKAYGLLDDASTLTGFGKSLHALKGNSSKLYEALARHILLHLHGMNLVECIREMTAAGEEVNLTTLRSGLAARGVHFPRGGKPPSMMRLWLAKAGVIIGSRWRVDVARLEQVLGIHPDEFAVLASFSPEQQAFLQALANIGGKEPQLSNHVAKLASATYGVEFPEKSLPKLILNDLEQAGYITAVKTTKGRGAKPFIVTATDKLITDVVGPMLDDLKGQIEPKLRALLRRPLTDILTELDSKHRYTRGLALEALAFKLMLLLGMKYVGTRLRARSTGGAEVDLVFEAARLVFSRWQIQCKNTSAVALDDVAKEVGLTHSMKSNVIVVVSTGKIGPEARKYANTVMADSNLCIVLIDGIDLDKIRENPSFIVAAFQREARDTMALKKLDLKLFSNGNE